MPEEGTLSAEQEAPTFTSVIYASADAERGLTNPLPELPDPSVLHTITSSRARSGCVDSRRTRLFGFVRVRVRTSLRLRVISIAEMLMVIEALFRAVREVRVWFHKSNLDGH
jgi:hypothetical protein